MPASVASGELHSGCFLVNSQLLGDMCRMRKTEQRRASTSPLRQRCFDLSSDPCLEGTSVRPLAAVEHSP